MKEAVAGADESETIYGKNFDGIPARVLKTPTSEKLMASRPFFTTVMYRAFQAARQLDIPLWKVIPGLMTQWDKMFVIAQFGAATQSIQAATVNGSLKDGVQFIGQSQGMINDIPSVEEIVQRVIKEARDVSQRQANGFEDSIDDHDLDVRAFERPRFGRTRFRPRPVKLLPGASRRW
jgi:enoyl-[acyl-carrier protein] reductase II